MVEPDDKELLFAGFASRLGTFGAKAKPQERLAAERKANRTPKQRARRAIKTTSINFRTTTETKALAQALSEQMDCGVASVVEQAIAHFAKSKGIKS